MAKEPIYRTEGIDMVAVADLKEHPKNPNVHTEAQIKRLAGIMLKTGVRRPLTVSKRSGYVTVGNGRLQAARLMGWERMPVSHQDYEDDDAEFADMVADNAIAEWSTLDMAAINYEVQSFDPGFDLDMLGFLNFTVDPADKTSVSFEAKTGAKELDEGDFEHFDHTCPKCGFHFDAE